MQPEPIAISHTTHTTNTSESASASQYGFQPDGLSSAELRDALDNEQAWSSDAGDEPPSVENSPHRVARLNDNSEFRPKPTFNRISEYENALSPAPRRRSSDGITFKVIKKKGNRLDGPQLDTFPNGKLASHTQIRYSYYLQRS